MRLQVELSAIQRDFRKSPALFRGFVGGRGAGKSWIGSYDLIRRAIPGRLYMVVAPTYTMLRDASLRSFLATCRELRFLRDFSESRMTAHLGNGAEILFRSGDDPDRLRGPNLSGAWLDEAGEMDEEVFTILIGCLRESGAQGWMSATFTPRGKRHWTYRHFVERAGPDTALFHARSEDNPFNQSGFADLLRSRYTSHFSKQEVDGEFIEPDGLIARREWFAQILEARPSGGHLVRAWDFAATAADVRNSKDPDWTVGALLHSDGAGKYTLAHLVRARVAGGQVEALVRQTAAGDGVAVHIILEQEPGSSGKIASDYLVRALAGYNVRATPAQGDKVNRAMPFFAQAEAGNVRLVRGAWNSDFLDEIAAFPSGAHDDQVDAASAAFNAIAHQASYWGPCGSV